MILFGKNTGNITLIRKLIKQTFSSINFTKVLQIYFPYSLQTNPSSFPGKSSGDCPKDWRKKE